MLKIKQQLKKNKYANIINAYIKSQLEKIYWRILGSKYRRVFLNSGIIYSEPEIEKRVKEKIKTKIKAQGAGKTKTLIYIGTDKNQDYSGFAQALEQQIDTLFFKDSHGRYGLDVRDKSGVMTIFCEQVRNENGQELLNLVRSNSDKCLMVIGQMLANFIPADVLSEVESMYIPIINISMDDKLSKNWGYRNGIRMGAIGLAKHVDLTLTTSPEVCDWYATEGCDCIFFPLASSPELFKESPESLLRDIEVSFIGNKYGVREEIINFLIAQGINISAWGNGWPNGSVGFDESAEIMKRSKIILGIGTVGHTRDHFTLKLRDFDAPMSGALYITHRSDVLKKIYDEGTEIEFYSNFLECAEKIKFYLNNDQQRIAIASKGQNTVVLNHNWDIRIDNLLSFVGFK